MTCCTRLRAANHHAGPKGPWIPQLKEYARAANATKLARCSSGELRGSIGAGTRAGAGLGDGHVAFSTARRRAGHRFDTRTRCLSSISALATHAQSRHRRRREMGALCQQQYGAKAAHVGARAAHRRSVRLARPDRRRTRLSRRLFSRLDRLGDGLAPLSFLAPHTERIYC